MLHFQACFVLSSPNIQDEAWLVLSETFQTIKNPRIQAQLMLTFALLSGMPRWPNLTPSGESKRNESFILSSSILSVCPDQPRETSATEPHKLSMQVLPKHPPDSPSVVLSLATFRAARASMFVGNLLLAPLQMDRPKNLQTYI